MGALSQYPVGVEPVVLVLLHDPAHLVGVDGGIVLVYFANLLPLRERKEEKRRRQQKVRGKVRKNGITKEVLEKREVQLSVKPKHKICY